MKKNILFYMVLCTPLFHTTYTMEPILPTQKRRKSLGHALSDKARSITSPRLKKQSESHESNLFSHKAHDQRLPSLTQEKSINKSIIIDPQEINKIHSHGETLLIWAAHNNNLSLIKKLLTHDDILINVKNIYHQTALHYIAEHKNKEIIEELLLNPQTDASLVNSDNKTAREMIEVNSEEDIELRRIIFARIMLDWTVNSVCKNLQDEYQYACHIATIDTDEDQKNVINKALVAIKSSLLKDQDNQKEEDRDLPSSAKLPDYADDNFIKQMISLRITKDSA